MSDVLYTFVRYQNLNDIQADKILRSGNISVVREFCNNVKFVKKNWKYLYENFDDVYIVRQVYRNVKLSPELVKNAIEKGIELETLLATQKIEDEDFTNMLNKFNELYEERGAINNADNIIEFSQYLLQDGFKYCYDIVYEDNYYVNEEGWDEDYDKVFDSIIKKYSGFVNIPKIKKEIKEEIDTENLWGEACSDYYNSSDGYDVDEEKLINNKSKIFKIALSTYEYMLEDEVRTPNDIDIYDVDDSYYELNYYSNMNSFIYNKFNKSVKERIKELLDEHENSGKDWYDDYIGTEKAPKNEMEEYYKDYRDDEEKMRAGEQPLFNNTIQSIKRKLLSWK